MNEYRKYIEKDRSLERRFQAIKVDPPAEKETIEILLGIKDRYEQFHRVERGHGTFHRVFHLPVPVDADRITADPSLEQGVVQLQDTRHLRQP